MFTFCCCRLSFNYVDRQCRPTLFQCWLCHYLPPPIIFLLRKLDYKLSFVWYKNLGKLSSVLSQSTRLEDDRRTDRHAYTFLVASPRWHSMQCGKNEPYSVQIAQITVHIIHIIGEAIVGDSWVSFVRNVRRDAGLCSTGSVAVAEPLY